uniref:Venom toxin-like peptide-5 n=1 Tax=Mesobuthus eupeus TaxID=34648 RepID=E4VP28_MESEU|nr:venom toxin-like peptide-5 [Mesobuthus eupeus]
MNYFKLYIVYAIGICMINMIENHGCYPIDKNNKNYFLCHLKEKENRCIKKCTDICAVDHGYCFTTVCYCGND